MSQLQNIVNMPSADGRWTSFTTTITAIATNPTPGTGYTSVSYYMQIGKILHIIYGFSQPVAGSSGAGGYLFNLPSGFTINTTVCPFLSSSIGVFAGNCIGTANIVVTGVNNGLGVCLAYDSSHYSIVAGNGAGLGYSQVSSGYFNLGFGAQQFYACLYVPIT